MFYKIIQKINTKTKPVYKSCNLSQRLNVAMVGLMVVVSLIGSLSAITLIQNLDVSKVSQAAPVCSVGYFNTNDNLCHEDVPFAGNKCFDLRSLPDGNNNCSGNSRALFRCDSGVPNKVFIWGGAGRPEGNDPGSDFCTTTEAARYFSVGSCFLSNVVGFGDLYNRADNMQRILSRTSTELLVNAGVVYSSNGGQPSGLQANFWFCGSPPTFVNPCPEGQEMLAHRATNRCSTPTFWTPGNNAMGILCIDSNFRNGITFASSPIGVFSVASGTASSYVADRGCEGPFQSGKIRIADTYDGDNHAERVQVCDSVSYPASIRYCNAGYQTYFSATYNVCFRTFAPTSFTCPAGQYLTSLSSDSCSSCPPNATCAGGTASFVTCTGGNVVSNVCIIPTVISNANISAGTCNPSSVVQGGTTTCTFPLTGSTTGYSIGFYIRGLTYSGSPSDNVAVGLTSISSTNCTVSGNNLVCANIPVPVSSLVGTLQVGVTIPDNKYYGNKGRITVTAAATSSSSSSSSTLVSSSSITTVSSSSTTLSNNGTILNVKVFLHGSFDDNTDLMTNTLIANDKIPAAQPYTAALSRYNYSGSETLPANSRADICDWVLVEIRNGTTDALVTSKAGMLLTNGNVIDSVNAVVNNSTVGMSFLSIPTTGSYKVVVRHRNHISIATNTNITITKNAITNLDFTSNLNVKGNGTNQAKIGNVGAGTAGVAIYGMRRGDITGEGQINSNDRSVLNETREATDTYSNKDINMDSKIDSVDRTQLLDAREATESV